MKNLKIQTKIITGFALVAVIGWILGAIGLVSVQRLGKLTDVQSDIRQSYNEAADVLTAHYEWRHGLTMAINNSTEFTGATDPTACALGKWLDSGVADTDDPVLQELFRKVVEPHSFIHNEAKTINEMILAGHTEEADADFEETILPKTNETITIIGDIEHHYSELLTEKTDELHSVQDSATVLITILFVVAVVASILLAVIVIKSIMAPLKKMRNNAMDLSVGNLHFENDYTIDDEIGHLSSALSRLVKCMKEQESVLAAYAEGDYTHTIEVRSEKDTVNQAINHLGEQTTHTLQDVRESAVQVSSGAQQMAQAAQNLATGSTQQAATLEELSATMSHILTESESSAQLASSALQDASKAGELMGTSMESMDKMLVAMQSIDESSSEITKVIKVIEDIAFQTNILALNAAVEAARAGQHGKGFAVVADEVRSLASKSAEAAKETSSLIERSSESVAEGNTIVQAVNEGLKAVGELAGRNADAVSQINDFSQQQHTDINEVTVGISQLSDVVQANSATAEETAASAEEMSAQSSILTNSVNMFRLGEGAPMLAITE